MKRVITIILAMAMALSICSVAYAEEPKITVKPNANPFRENSGTVNMSFNVDNQSDSPIKLAAVQPNGGFIVSAAASDATAADNTGIVEIPPKSKKAINVTATTTNNGDSAGTLNFIFSYKTSEDVYDVVTVQADNFSVVRTPSATEAPTEETKKEDSEFRIRTSSVDSNGVCVLTPSGDYGDQLEVRLPLTCTNGYVYDLKVTPVLSNDIEKFPFDIDLVDYTLSYPGSIGRGQVVEFLYHLRLSKKATVGVKQVDFNVTYRNDEGDLKSGTVSLFVNVRKGLSPTSDKDTTTSVPKLIIESYKLSSDKIYAGETFDPTGMVIKAVYADESEVIMTDYTLDKTTLSAGDESVTVTVTADGKTYTLQVLLNVQGGQETDTTAPDTETATEPATETVTEPDTGITGTGTEASAGGTPGWVLPTVLAAVILVGGAVAAVLILRRRKGN